MKPRYCPGRYASWDWGSKRTSLCSAARSCIASIDGVLRSRLTGAGGAFGAIRDRVPALVAGDRGVGLLRHEVRGGGIEEQQVDLEA
ncbi:MAG TPA: hypothetical protein VE979_00935, partial [Streptosporangiaceae bacterium]|nr:hypothetical protein [Streptosporangiaceae bacterium]